MVRLEVILTEVDHEEAKKEEELVDLTLAQTRTVIV
jgi:hypothetical protein